MKYNDFYNYLNEAFINKDEFNDALNKSTLQYVSVEMDKNGKIYFSPDFENKVEYKNLKCYFILYTFLSNLKSYFILYTFLAKFKKLVYKSHFVTIFIDIEKAFDNVWHTGLSYKLNIKSQTIWEIGLKILINFINILSKFLA